MDVLVSNMWKQVAGRNSIKQDQPFTLDSSGNSSVPLVLHAYDSL